MRIFAAAMKKNDNISDKKPVIISGPCSVESREQTVATYTALAETGMVDMIRAGIWKPRTNPNSFEGVGECGFEWLEEGKRLTGLPFGVEVANARHLETAVAHGADMVWIGARTTGNPFSVQEIADAIRGIDIKVLVKNPLTMDIALWEGAVRRILNSADNPENVWLVHRGFSQMGNGTFRNPPMWHLAIEMRRRFPEMTILCDPSHICGNRENIATVSQKAADLDYDGLIIESHCCPQQALTDAAQQVTPESLAEILTGIIWRTANTENRQFLEALERCRYEIDELDSEIFALMSRRMEISEQIGRIKKDNDITILQDQRWNAIQERLMSKAAEWGLSLEFIRDVLDAIHVESINHQNKVMN